MRTLRTAFGSVIALTVALSLAGPAMAQNNNLDEVGAAIVMPVITSDYDHTVTLNVVTNVSPSAKILHVNVIDGYDWNAFNWSCFVTASETTLFRFSPAGEYHSRVTFECTNPATLEPIYFEDTLQLTAGVMFVSVEDPTTGDTINENSIFGDSVVIAFQSGYAWSVGAISFQGGSVMSGDDLADRNYQFDGEEYSNFPSVLATNFIAPYDGRRLGVDAYLVLFTLDGTVAPGGSGPSAHLTVTFYNDDERHFSTGISFDCFTIVELREVDSRFDAFDLASDAGHMFMVPEITSQTNQTHDFLWDGGIGFDGQRRTPVHGWIFQTIHIGARATLDGPQIGEAAAWGRTLNQSTTALVPSTGDVPTLATNSPN